MKVAIAFFPRNTSLDAIGPYEVLQRVPSIDVVFVGHRRGEVRSDNGMLGLTCDAAFDEVTEPDALIFPGGIGTRTLIHDNVVLDWGSTGCAKSQAHAVHHLGMHGRTCARRGRSTERAHSHHALAGAGPFNSLGATYVPQRVVEHLPERIITAAAVSSGIDMGLRLVELLSTARPPKPAS
jgi:hypothetical protein